MLMMQGRANRQISCDRGLGHLVEFLFLLFVQVVIHEGARLSRRFVIF